MYRLHLVQTTLSEYALLWASHLRLLGWHLLPTESSLRDVETLNLRARATWTCSSVELHQRQANKQSSRYSIPPEAKGLLLHRCEDTSGLALRLFLCCRHSLSLGSAEFDRGQSKHRAAELQACFGEELVTCAHKGAQFCIYTAAQLVRHLAANRKHPAEHLQPDQAGLPRGEMVYMSEPLNM